MASLTEYGCRPYPAGSRPPARAHQGPLSILPVPHHDIAGWSDHTAAAGGGVRVPVVYSGKRPVGGTYNRDPGTALHHRRAS